MAEAPVGVRKLRINEQRFHSRGSLFINPIALDTVLRLGLYELKRYGLLQIVLSLTASK
jgi:hypothetical protein